MHVSHAQTLLHTLPHASTPHTSHRQYTTPHPSSPWLLRRSQGLPPGRAWAGGRPRPGLARTRAGWRQRRRRQTPGCPPCSRSDIGGGGGGSIRRSGSGSGSGSTLQLGTQSGSELAAARRPPTFRPPWGRRPNPTQPAYPPSYHTLPSSTPQGRKRGRRRRTHTRHTCLACPTPTR